VPEIVLVFGTQSVTVLKAVKRSLTAVSDFSLKG